MANNREDEKRNTDNERKSTGPVAWVGRFVGMVLATLFFSVLIELIFITFVYPELGAKHAIEVYLKEQSWIEADYSKGIDLLGGVSPYTILGVLSEWINNHVLGALSWLGDEPHYGMQNGSYLTLIDDYMIGAGIVVCITFYRACILLLSMPVYGLAVFIGVSYGITRRDIRKYNIGRESNRRHYLAKRMILPSLYIPWLIYLSTPYAIHPAYVVVPTALVTFLAIRFSLEYFEKVF